MKSAENLLKRLGVEHYTKRHLRIINEFIDNNETDSQKLLNDLGGNDARDLAIVNGWVNEK